MKNKITLFVSFLAGIILLISCLKDKVGETWVDAVAFKMYATIPAFTINTLALAPVSGDQPFSFLVNIATDALPTQDITLTFAVDNNAVTLYNKLHDIPDSTKFLPYPNVQLITQTVVIPKGTRNDTILAKVWGADLVDACSKYMTAVTIKSATTADGKAIPIASNMQTYYLSLPVSNPYAGNYHCVGYRQHPTLGFFDVDKMEVASTVDCKTIRKSGFGDYPYDMSIQITSDVIVVSGVNCFKVNVTVIDPGTNAPVSSGQGMYSTFTGTASHSPSPLTLDVNYYNPVTKTFVLNAYYNSSANRLAYEVLTRL